MSVLQGLSFARGSSVIHSLDPRSKMALASSIASSSIILRGHLYPSLALLALSIALIAMAGCLRRWLPTLRGLSLLAAMVFAVNAPFSGVAYAASMVVLLLTLVASLSAFFLTTSPDELSLALVKLRLPYELSLELSMAIRFVPTLAREAQLIVDAQRARGLDLESGFIRRLRNLIPILIPLVVNTVRRSYRVAEAMESRGFGASRSRTWLYELRLRARDYAALACSALMLALSAIYAYT